MRLNVNVAGAFLDGQRQDIVGKPHDGCILGRSRQVRRIRLLFLFLLNFEAAQNFVLQVLETLHLKFPKRSFLFVPRAVLFLLPVRFLDSHEIRVNRIHEPFEVVLGTNLRLDDNTLDVAPDIIKRDQI